MKVIQLGPFPPPHGGVQTNLVAIRNYLRRRGHAAAVINLTRHRRTDADQVFYPQSAAQTVSLLLRQPADILHLHIGGNLSRRLLGLGLFCSLLPARRSVLTFHSGGYPSSPPGQAMRRNSLAGFVLRRFDAVIAVNTEIADFMRRCGVREQRLQVISPHTLLTAAAELPEPLQSFYAAHHPVFLSVGLLEPEYDLALQIAALGRLRVRHPRAGLAMIGSGSLDAELRALIAAQPWSKHVLLPGDVPHPATLRAIRNSTLLLRTTRYDGDSIAVREALEIGTPVIATENRMRPPGCRLIPAASLERLLEAIEAVLAGDAPPPAPSAGDRNLEAVLELYTKLHSG